MEAVSGTNRKFEIADGFVEAFIGIDFGDFLNLGNIDGILIEIDEERNLFLKDFRSKSDGIFRRNRTVGRDFERQLVAAGFAPDRLTVDLSQFQRVSKFFDLAVERLSSSEFNETLIDREADPVGWRQQQIRIRRLKAAKRARAALSEPPYHAVFLAMDAKTASLVRSRLPMRSRVWGTPMINPGDPKTDPQAKAMICGMTLATEKGHVCRAALEAIAYQIKDLVDLMTNHAGIVLKELRVDGGPTKNHFLMQFQADMLNACINRSDVEEASAMGAMVMNGLARNVWADFDEVASLRTSDNRIVSAMSEKERNRLYSGWHEAVNKVNVR